MPNREICYKCRATLGRMPLAVSATEWQCLARAVTVRIGGYNIHEYISVNDEPPKGCLRLFEHATLASLERHHA